jgi:peptidoglycan/LPS O-acetylase OafA/YrhL
MSGLVVLAALASIVITAALAWVLWRMNAAPARRDQGGDGDD